jgi:hypothetical protein
MVKRIYDPAGSRTICFGRNRPEPGFRPKLHFGKYLNLSTLPTPPGAWTYATKAYSALAEIYANDTLGCCVTAEILHSIGVFTGNADGGSPLKFTQAQAVAIYSAIGGYVPGDPSTDNGCDIDTALEYMQTTGFPTGQNKFAGRLAVDPTNQEKYTAALWLFENLDFGIELPEAWITPFPSAPGFHWDVAGAPNPDNGHSFLAVAYDKRNVYPDTWGMLGSMSDAAVAMYASPAASGELYTVLSDEIMIRATQKAPTGFDFEQLEADLAAF